MPIETSPIPFGDQLLPYNPKFVASVDDQGTMMPSVAGTMMPGIPHTHSPAGVAGSALIAPDPGGIAGPHRAIPALPDAGYTAPNIRSVSIAGYPPNLGPQGGGHLSNVPFPGPATASLYAGGSAHGPPASVLGSSAAHIPAQIPQPRRRSNSILSDGWSASLPEPRRAPVTPMEFPLDGIQSQRAPVQDVGRGHPHREHRERCGSGEWDDGASDASYYAMPKRHRRDGSRSDMTDHAHISPSRRIEQRRDDCQNSPSVMDPSWNGARRQSISGAQDTRPRATGTSPAPLRSISRSYRHEQYHARSEDHVPSPLGPVDAKHGSPEQRMGRLTLNVAALSPEAPRGRRHSSRPLDAPVSDSEEVHTRRRALRSRSVTRERSRDDASPAGFEGDYLAPPVRQRTTSRRGVDGTDVRSPPGRQSSARPASNRTNEGSGPLLESPYHAPTMRPCSPTGPTVAPRRHRRSSDAHEYHEPTHPTPTVSRHRRHSFSLDDAPPPQSGIRRPASEYALEYHQAPLSGSTIFPFHSPSHIGDPAFLSAPGPHQGYPDDTGSAAGSQLTFMDGAIDGRVSQYGLPKYAHQPKVDYRRFCVQRGKADVFLD